MSKTTENARADMASGMYGNRAEAWAAIAQAEALERIADRLESADALTRQRRVGPG